MTDTYLQKVRNEQARKLRRYRQEQRVERARRRAQMLAYPLNSPQYEGLDPFKGGEEADDEEVR